MPSPEETVSHFVYVSEKLQVDIDSLRRLQMDDTNGELSGQIKRYIALAITDMESSQNWMSVVIRKLTTS